MRVSRVPLTALGERIAPAAFAYATDYPRLSSRYPVDWRDPAALEARARRAVARGVPAGALDRTEARLRELGAPQASLEALARLRRGAAAVVAGHQPSGAWGPLYNLYKAIGALKLARDLEARGVPAVAVFWNHSDDHNAAEVALCRIPRSEGDVVQIRMLEDDPPKAPLYARSVRPEAIEELRAQLAGWPHAGPVMSLLERPGSLSERYTRLMLAVLGSRGLVVVEPRDLDVPAAREVMRRALRDPALVQAAIESGGRDFERAGFQRPLKGDFGANVFAIDGDVRERASPDSPGRLSPGVAMRLIVQDTVLPTAAFVGGPNESAYIGQLRELYAFFGLEMPAIVPRITATFVEPRVARAVRKLGLADADLLAGEAELLKRRAADGRVLRAVNDATAQVLARFRELEPDFAAVEPPLADLARKTADRLHGVMDAFMERITQAQTRADETGRLQVRKVAGHVTPEGRLQERVLSPALYFAAYGLDLAERMMDALAPDGREHQIVWLD